MNYYFGAPGEAPRTVLCGLIHAEIALNLQAGEVCVVTDTVIDGPKMMSDDGKSIVSRDPHLEEVRADALFAARKHAYDLEFGGLKTTWGPIATDIASQSRIAAHVSAAMIAKMGDADYSISWRMMDDQYVTLSANDMMAVGSMLASFINAVHVRKHEVLNALTAATTLAEVEAVAAVKAGFPAK